MALFYKVVPDEINAILQLDKRTLNSIGKYFAHATTRFSLTFDAVSGIPAALFTRSFPIDSENVSIKSIDVQREILLSDARGISFLNPELLNLPLPYFRDHIFVGFSDQDTTGAATVYDLNSYIKNNSISIPCQLDGNSQRFHLDNIGEQFQLKKNKGFLNIFERMEFIDIGDITDFVTMLTAKFNYAGLTISTIGFEYSVNIAGRLI